MRDLYSNDVETAAYLAREADAYAEDRPTQAEYDPEPPLQRKEWRCPYCGWTVTADCDGSCLTSCLTS